MSTTTRPPNKTLWALDEAIGEHDPQLAQRVEALTKQIRREMDEAGRRFDKAAQARLGEMALTVLERLADAVEDIAAVAITLDRVLETAETNMSEDPRVWVWGEEEK